MTPLHLAAERARVKVIEYLVGREADIINIQDWNGVKILCVTVLMMKDYTVCATFGKNESTYASLISSVF